jgi:hypothetical protein
MIKYYLLAPLCIMLIGCTPSTEETTSTEDDLPTFDEMIAERPIGDYEIKVCNGKTQSFNSVSMHDLAGKYIVAERYDSVLGHWKTELYFLSNHKYLRIHTKEDYVDEASGTYALEWKPPYQVGDEGYYTGVDMLKEEYENLTEDYLFTKTEHQEMVVVGQSKVASVVDEISYIGCIASPNTDVFPKPTHEQCKEMGGEWRDNLECYIESYEYIKQSPTCWAPTYDMFANEISECSVIEDYSMRVECLSDKGLLPITYFVDDGRIDAESSSVRKLRTGVEKGGYAVRCLW